jgi:hypothetical protein
MATISNTTLTLTPQLGPGVPPVVTSVLIEVTYDATFTQLEHSLANNGLVFQEVIKIRGDDAPFVPPNVVSSNDVLLNTQPFPIQTIPLPAGNGPVTISRSRSLTVARSVLNEDPQPNDPDEIYCTIDIMSFVPPGTATGFTPQKVLA